MMNAGPSVCDTSATTALPAMVLAAPPLSVPRLVAKLMAAQSATEIAELVGGRCRQHT